MDSLPPEILTHIFRFLPTSFLHVVDQVCHSWSSLIVQRFWRNELQSLVKNDCHLSEAYTQHGWLSPPHHNDYKLIRFLYYETRRRLFGEWKKPLPFLSRLTLDQGPFQRVVSSIRIYKDKFFVSYKDSRLESRNFPKLTLRTELIIESRNSLAVWSCPLALQGVLLAVVSAYERSISLFNAQNEKLIYSVLLGTIGFVRDVKLNNKHMIGMVDWSFVIWRINPERGTIPSQNPVTVSDFSGMFAFEHRLFNHIFQVNTDFLVSSACSRRTGAPTEAWIRVRRFNMNGTANDIISSNQYEPLKYNVIRTIKLASSPENILAVLHYELDCPEAFSITLVNISNGALIRKLSAFRTEGIYIPRFWFGGRTLIFQINPVSEREKDGSVIKFVSYNVDTSIYSKAHSIQGNSDDLFSISLSQLVQVHHAYYKTFIGKMDTYVNTGTVYSFWV